MPDAPAPEPHRATVSFHEPGDVLPHLLGLDGLAYVEAVAEVGPLLRSARDVGERDHAEGPVRAGVRAAHAEAVAAFRDGRTPDLRLAIFDHQLPYLHLLLAMTRGWIPGGDA